MKNKENLFKVFDGMKIHQVDAKHLADFIERYPYTVAVQSWDDKKIELSRINITKSKKTYSVQYRKNISANTKTVGKRIVAIAKNHKRKIFENIATCSKQLNIDDSNISKVLKGKRNTANGYKFEYI